MARPIVRTVASAVVGYLVALLPSAEIAARLASGGDVDLRRDGTGNPGGANAVGVLGRRWGLGVMAADIAKGAFACRVGRRLAGDTGQHVGGVAAVVGHCYPANRGFQGGKGVATSVGQCLATFPVYVPIDLGIAFGVQSIDPSPRRAHVATMTASVTWVLAGVLWWRRGLPNAWGGAPTAGLPLGAAASSAVLYQRFRAANGRDAGER
ncbi:MAG: glycerol-3-phosphate acyltransferase [Acidimicrobiales bacterium]|nr:glycerol-3-phosphate acyltransferase [Acidimicrobiales bacterium]